MQEGKILIAPMQMGLCRPSVRDASGCDPDSPLLPGDA
jgi:hypothetical protein